MCMHYTVHSKNSAKNAPVLLCYGLGVITLKSRQDGRHFPDDIFKCIFLNENTTSHYLNQ